MGRAQSGFIWEKYVLSQSIKHCAKHINQSQVASSLSLSLSPVLPETSQTNNKETGEEAEIHNRASSTGVSSVFILFCLSKEL